MLSKNFEFFVSEREQIKFQRISSPQFLISTIFITFYYFVSLIFIINMHSLPSIVRPAISSGWFFVLISHLLSLFVSYIFFLAGFRFLMFDSVTASEK